MIWSSFIDIEEFEESLQEGQEQVLKGTQAILERESLDDVHGYMSWWGVFDEDDSSFSPSVSSVVLSVAASSVPFVTPSVAASSVPSVTPSVAPAKKQASKRAAARKRSNKARKKKKRKKAKASRKKKRRR